MNFWGTAIGRSGTVWLASLLDKAPNHTVRHEEAEGKHVLRPDAGWKPFPLERWLERAEFYGEIHGLLLRYLSPDYSGLQKLIPRRFIVLRNPANLVASWMNRDEHTLNDVDWITREIMRRFTLLTAYAESDPGCRVYRFEDLVSGAELQHLIDWLEMDMQVSDSDLEAKNANRENWFSAKRAPLERHADKLIIRAVTKYYPDAI